MCAALDIVESEFVGLPGKAENSGSTLPGASRTLCVMFSRCLACLNPIMLTYMPVNNCGYIVLSVQVVVSSKFWAHIQYMGHSFIGLLPHAACGILIYSKYLCLAILSILNLVLSGCY